MILKNHQSYNYRAIYTEYPPLRYFIYFIVIFCAPKKSRRLAVYEITNIIKRYSEPFEHRRLRQWTSTLALKCRTIKAIPE